MCSPDETRIMSPSAPLGEKKMNSFAFESGEKRSTALDSSHIDRTSEEIVLHWWRKRNQIISSKKQEVFSTNLKLLHRQNHFYHSNPFNRFQYCITIFEILQNIVRMRHELLILPACFPRKTRLFRFSIKPNFLKVPFQLFSRSSMEFWFLDCQSFEASKWIFTSFYRNMARLSTTLVCAFFICT